jgi:hypothetical protein
MKLHAPIRPAIAAALGLLLAAVPAYARWGQGGGQKGASPRIFRQAPPPAVVERSQRRPNANGNIPRQEQRQQRAIGNQGHLSQWMQSHSNLSLPDQQRALQNEPGFRQLPPQLQQRELNQLGRLYSMNPQQRERQLNRVEQLERMSPAQRQQWNAATQQLYALSPPRRGMVARAMLDLREMPPAQREQVIDSPAFTQQFPDPGDRAMIRTLLMAEPYPPTAAR